MKTNHRLTGLKISLKSLNALFILSICAFTLFLTSCNKEIKVACVGDSITEGYGLSVQSKTGYPVVLNQLLGSNYSVLNLGRSATTLQRHADFPYWIAKEFSDVFAYKPNIIIIKLGTNDTKPQNWNSENYKNDYQALIDTFKTISTNPKIYLCYPVPVFKTKWGINDSTVVHGVIPVIAEIAKKNNLPVIDLYHSMGNQGASFPDSIHPNEEAVKVMAGFIAKAIKSN
jgi:acyl-CoA thioesterase I